MSDKAIKGLTVFYSHGVFIQEGYRASCHCGCLTITEWGALLADNLHAY